MLENSQIRDCRVGDITVMSKSLYSVEWPVGAVRVQALCSDKFSENYIDFPIVQKLGLIFEPLPGSTTIQIAPGKCLQYLGYLYLYFNLASNRNVTGYTKFFVVEGDLLPHGVWLGTAGTGEIPKRVSPEAHPVEEDPQSKGVHNVTL